MEKNFDVWNERKKLLNRTEHSDRFFYHEREVWWCSLGLNIGVESDGKHENFERPVLVVKKFNKEMFWGIPLTSKPKHGLVFEEISHAHGTSWGVLSQLKNFSSKRLERKIGMIPRNQFIEIKNRIAALITSSLLPDGKRLSEAEATNI